MADADTTSVNFSSACAHAFVPVTTGFAAAETAGALVVEAVTTGGKGKDDAVEEVVVGAETAGATAGETMVFISLRGDEAGVSTGAVDATTAGVGATDLATTAGAASAFISAVLGCELPVNAPRQFNTNNITAASKNNKAPND